jgi:hypothetical protein
MKRTVFLTILVAGLMMPGIPASQETGFLDNGDGTVTDNATGLMWQRCSAGLSGSDCSSGSTQTRNWEAALSYCEDLSLAGHVDWRLPDVKELRSIVDNARYSPAIDTTAFPGTIAGGYWSSSTYANGTDSAWYVYFDNGNVNYSTKTNPNYVRCVR